MEVLNKTIRAQKLIVAVIQEHGIKLGLEWQNIYRV